MRAAASRPVYVHPVILDLERKHDEREDRDGAGLNNKAQVRRRKSGMPLVYKRQIPEISVRPVVAGQVKPIRTILLLLLGLTTVSISLARANKP